MARRKRRSPRRRRRRNQPGMGIGTLLLLGAGAWFLFGRQDTPTAPVAPQSLPPTPPVPPHGALDPIIPDELNGNGAPDFWSATVDEINFAQANIDDLGQSIAPDVIDELIMSGAIPPDAFDAFAAPLIPRPIRLMPGIYAVPLALVQSIAPFDEPYIDPFEGGEWF